MYVLVCTLHSSLSSCFLHLFLSSHQQFADTGTTNLDSHPLLGAGRDGYSTAFRVLHLGWRPPRVFPTRIVFRQQDSIYYSQIPRRRVKKDDIRLEDLSVITPVPVEAYRPPFDSTFTIADLDPRTWHQHYLKEPTATSFDPEAEAEPKDYVLQDIAACEVLRSHPHHPNIAVYHGCLITGGLVSALVFDRYEVSLLDLLNPQSLNKAAFLGSDRPVTPETSSCYLEGIKAGIDHLHSIGLVHNDLNPANVMVSGDGRPVIIDFDSCLPIGVPLNKPKRTPGWYDPDVSVSLETNDLYALEELRV